jgi:threonine 3-dehydrogenase
MLALRKTTAAPGLEACDDVPVPVPGPGEVLIAVRAAGVCGSDKGIYDWEPWAADRVLVGVTVGHEFMGHVVAVGDAVTRVSVGQRVSGEGHITCGRCKPCRTGNGHVCESVSVIGVDRDGCFADHVVMPEANVWPLHDSIPDDVAAILDPIGNAMHTVMTAGVGGRSVLVTGSGAIGAIAIAIARAAGAGLVIATDVSADRRELAAEMGADHVLAADDEDWPAEARRLTSGSGPDVLLEMSGHPAALRGGLRALGNGGTAALLGVPSRPVEIDLLNDVIFKGLTLHGISGRRMYETWFQVETFLLGGRLRLDPVISHRVPLRDHEQAFSLISGGRPARSFSRRMPTRASRRSGGPSRRPVDPPGPGATRSHEASSHGGRRGRRVPRRWGWSSSAPPPRCGAAPAATAPARRRGSAGRRPGRAAG